MSKATAKVKGMGATPVRMDGWTPALVDDEAIKVNEKSGGLIMKDGFISSLVAIGAGIASTLLGGWDKSLEILLIFIIMDYITGVGAAFKTKTLKSSVGFEGLMKKGAIFLIVILAAQLDRITGNAAGVFRTATAFFFIANDALSVLENVGEMGVKLPAFLTNALTKLRDENEGVGDNSEESGGSQKPN